MYSDLPTLARGEGSGHGHAMGVVSVRLGSTVVRHRLTLGRISVPGLGSSIELPRSFIDIAYDFSSVVAEWVSPPLGLD